MAEMITGFLKSTCRTVPMVFVFTGTGRTAPGNPCVSGSKMPFQDKCLRSLYKQPLEAKYLQEKRKSVNIKRFHE